MIVRSQTAPPKHEARIIICKDFSESLFAVEFYICYTRFNIFHLAMLRTCICFVWEMRNGFDLRAA